MADDESVPRDPTVPSEQQPEPGTDPAVPAAGGASAPAPILKTRWRDRAWTFRAMLAVAAASLVIGAVAGGVIGAAAGGDDDEGHYRMGPGGPGMKMPPGWRHRGPGFDGPGGPQWRWNDQPGQQLTPYGGASPSTPGPAAPSPSAPGSTG